MPFRKGDMAARPARTRPVRLTLFGLLVVPFVSLVALWGVAVGGTLGSAVTEHEYNSVARRIGTPTEALSADLSQEQAQTFVWLSTGGRAPLAPLNATRRRTDVVVAAARSALESIRSKLPAPAVPPLNALDAKLGQLGNIRAAVDSQTLSAPLAFQAYSSVIDAEFTFFEHALKVQDASLYQQTTGTTDASRALVMIGREAALVGGALAAQGQMSTADRELFANTVTSQRLLTGDALAQLGPGIRDKYVQAYSSPTYHRFAAMENLVAASIGSHGPVPVNPQAWVSVSGSFLATMQNVETENSIFLDKLSNQLSSKLVTEAVLAGGIGLVAVVASLFLMLRFGRRLTGELTSLHTSAQSMAEERLPSVVERLRNGEEVDVAAESPPPNTGKIAEIAKVAQAFGTVQRTAVEAAVGQANLRKGVNRVFLNLSLRNQSLLHRQLGLLDSMERATSEPSALADLFRVDHLTTRMRRHAEGLIILSGATPGRGWRDPVSAIDVLRAAIAEVEDYVRVDVISESRDAIIGIAVNDVIHLIAELVENATAFSPPNTMVEIKADAVGNGFAVEIEDRGLGLTDAEMAEINERLATPPEFDLANSDQLGLFVVGQLAARHGIKVSLCGSPYGGTRAIVLLPLSIMVRDGETGEHAHAGNGGRPAAASPVTGPPLVRASNPGGSRERTSIFSLTGRHRLPDEQIIPELASPVADAGVADAGLADAGVPDAGVAHPGYADAGFADSGFADSGFADAGFADAGFADAEWAGQSQAAAGPSPSGRSQAAPWPETPWPEAPWPTAPRPEAPRPAAPSRKAPSYETTSHETTSRETTSRETLWREAPSPSQSLADAGSHLGMPRRVRQASLAPQLRASVRPHSGAPVPAAQDPAARSPEQARNVMSALQAGWEHGRTDDLDHPVGRPEGGPGDDLGMGLDSNDGEAT
jgi:signal transduction histidine kinase